MYLLSDTGELGYYGQDMQPIIDTLQTQRFKEHNIAFLNTYRANPNQPGKRLGIIYPAAGKTWVAPTLGLETHILRILYPVGGVKTDILTSFQKKNREKSVHRAMELLLDYRYEATPEAAVYVPVLHDRGTTLADYPSLLNQPVADSDRQTPVIEVLNLIEALPTSRRMDPDVQALKKSVYAGAIRKDMRASPHSALHGLIDNPYSAQHPTDPSPEAYTNIDKRAERQVSIPVGYQRALEDDPLYLDLLATLGAGRMEQWLTIPPAPVAPDILARFVTFQQLDETSLARAARRTLVHRAPPGIRLLERGTSDDWNLYLIEGRLQLDANDGMTELTDSGSQKAKSPVAFLKPRKYRVTTLTQVEFLWVHDAVVDLARKEKSGKSLSGL